MSSGYTAMIINPTEETTIELQALLEKQGVQVVEWWRSGTGWITGWQKRRPDFVFLDLQLPKRDGLYVLGKLRELDPGARVIFLHGYQGMMANDVELKALAAGAIAVLQRPLVPNRFRAVVGRAVDMLARDRKLQIRLA